MQGAGLRPMARNRSWSDVRHLILCREFPPAAYPAGGIGTYVATIARLLAAAGDTVHVIGEQHPAVPDERTTLHDGRLVIHRVPTQSPDSAAVQARTISPLAWAWNATLRAEQLVEREGIDVIEAQEWEAPLLFFLLRRALGAGPAWQPPLITHLHSPSESVWAHNEWPLDEPYLHHVARAESVVIQSADALLSPSAFLADEVAAQRDAGRAMVIPYPIASPPPVSAPRPADAPVVFVGRLEPRKGVHEFLDAVIDVMRTDTSFRVELIGADVRQPDGASNLDRLQRRVPAERRGRIRFTGALPRKQVLHRLASARFAVVPSRWENFPNTCLEAMAAGTPVLVSPNGGMREVVEDGASGWIAPGVDAVGLAEALRRGLAAPPEALDAMGASARTRVRQVCDPATIVAAQRAFRADCVARGATRSRSMPPGLNNARSSNDAGLDACLDILLHQLPALTSDSDRFTPGLDEWSGITMGDAIDLPFNRKLGLLRQAIQQPWRARAWLRTVFGRGTPRE